MYEYPDAPVSSPAAWPGIEQRNRGDWIYHLSDAEKCVSATI
jgi:hypothetical protein